ncbi:hypothetical protein BH09ACT4_BH09ACT4_24580 [soil metagenome]
MTTSQTPIVPAAAPAPLSAAPVEEPVSSIWPETMGERPSPRSALASTEVPAPTPPREAAPAPEGEAEADETEDADADADADGLLPEPASSGLSIADLVEAEVEAEVDAEPESEPEPEPEPGVNP